MGAGAGARVHELSGQGQNRTADTAVFSRVLCQLSYLAPTEASECSDSRLETPLRQPDELIEPAGDLVCPQRGWFYPAGASKRWQAT